MSTIDPIEKYEALRREQEALRREYEALRREYEALRLRVDALSNEDPWPSLSENQPGEPSPLRIFSKPGPVIGDKVHREDEPIKPKRIE